MASDSVRKLLREGESLRWQRDFDGAASLFREARRVAADEGDLRSVATALVWMSVVLRLKSPGVAADKEALELQREALAIEDTLLPLTRPQLGDTLRVMADTLESIGEREEALQAAARAIEIFEGLNLQSLPVEGAYATFVRLARDLGRHAEARAGALKLIGLCRTLQSPMGLVAAHMEAGDAALSLGLADEAVAHFEEVLRVAEPRIREGKAQRLVAEVSELLARAREMREANPKQD